MRPSKLLNFMPFAGSVTSVVITSPGNFHFAKTHTIDLPEQSIAIHNLPNTFIQMLDARAPSAIVNTIHITNIQETETGEPILTPHSVTLTTTTTSTVPVVTSTMSDAAESPLPPQISPVAPPACADSLCKQSVILGYSSPVTTAVAVWSSGHPGTQTLFTHSLTTSGHFTWDYTTPVATVMASSIDPSSFSYSFIESTTQQFSTTTPSISAGTVTPTDTVSTHGPPPEITTTDSFPTLSGVTTTEIPASWSNNITSPIPTVTSVHFTTVDPSTNTTAGTASATATFGDMTSTTTTIAATSSGFTQPNESTKTYGSLLKNKFAVLMAIAAVVNFSFAAM
ncbi:hypothetical protein LTR70_002816 [Exophiala xenobiotica]|uniref:Uncharacterized protein n=1 Tax=Lithohypha guttulata TaxID=1690604 RepID=A0ABR0KJ59_9EURO|nr:hypothetical protein LTR24_002030 [Lithohypha guttulata]KAK5324532.1 hypothetical protein LTR70_002816 [Exophiala xenobiotica]